ALALPAARSNREPNNTDAMPSVDTTTATVQRKINRTGLGKYVSTIGMVSHSIGKPTRYMQILETLKTYFDDAATPKEELPLLVKLEELGKKYLDEHAGSKGSTEKKRADRIRAMLKEVDSELAKLQPDYQQALANKDFTYLTKVGAKAADPKEEAFQK